MKSPRFVLREAEIKEVFSSYRLKHTWKHKVRAKMRNHFLPDPIEHLDFHLTLAAQCAQLEQLVGSGYYLPAPAHRILMEKSKGLCRQLVIPNVWDALVLQCLSDALYTDIKGKAPSKRSFFEPEDHTFSKVRTSILGERRYGSLRAWLDFQKELFIFAETKKYVVITDVANYYDYISYAHLRNIIAGKIQVRECVLDMLIFVLSGLLWQPDYAPRVEIGLPQMDIDASRILAHGFLYELDEFLEKAQLDFVRYMDDIDISVDSIDEAKALLREIDLILQTRQVRLNSGKTTILRSYDAERHFRVRENYVLNKVISHIDHKIAHGLPLNRERKHIRKAMNTCYKGGNFDDGNGEKVLSRMMSLSKRMGARVDIKLLNDVLRRRPAARSAAFGVIEWQTLTPCATETVVNFLMSRAVVDEWAYVEGANTLVHCEVRSKPNAVQAVSPLVDHLAKNGFFGVYAALWLMSKYCQANRVYQVLLKARPVWESDVWLGRLVGGLAPIFHDTAEDSSFRNLLRAVRNPGAEEVMHFHQMLRTDPKAVSGVRKIMMAPNTSKRLGITHAKFLMLLSILANSSISAPDKRRYIHAHRPAWRDAFYRWRARAVVTPTGLRGLIKA